MGKALKKTKSILVCRKCSSRNYAFTFPSNRTKTLSLNKYCSHCRKSVIHDENR